METDAHRIVEDLPQVGRRGSGDEPCRLLPVDGAVELARRCEVLEQRHPLGLLGQAEAHPHAEAAAAQQGWVQVARCVGRTGHHQQPTRRAQAVDGGKQGDQRLPAFRIVAEVTLWPAHVVDLVEVQDGLVRIEAPEEVAHARGRQFIGGDLVEGDIGAEQAGKVASAQRLSGPSRTVEQHAAREGGADSGEVVGHSEALCKALHLPLGMTNSDNLVGAKCADIDPMLVEPRLIKLINRVGLLLHVVDVAVDRSRRGRSAAKRRLHLRLCRLR